MDGTAPRLVPTVRCFRVPWMQCPAGAGRAWGNPAAGAYHNVLLTFGALNGGEAV